MWKQSVISPLFVINMSVLSEEHTVQTVNVKRKHTSLPGNRVHERITWRRCFCLRELKSWVKAQFLSDERWLFIKLSVDSGNFPFNGSAVICWTVSITTGLHFLLMCRQKLQINNLFLHQHRLRPLVLEQSKYKTLNLDVTASDSSFCESKYGDKKGAMAQRFFWSDM